MESFVRFVTTKNYEEFATEDLNKPKVLLFTNKKTTPALFKALSKDLKGKLIFGQIRDNEEELISKFRVTAFPTLMVLSDP
jgi:DnaJ family protein C protein 16